MPKHASATHPQLGALLGRHALRGVGLAQGHSKLQVDFLAMQLGAAQRVQRSLRCRLAAKLVKAEATTGACGSEAGGWVVHRADWAAGREAGSRSHCSQLGAPCISPFLPSATHEYSGAKGANKGCRSSSVTLRARLNRNSLQLPPDPSSSLPGEPSAGRGEEGPALQCGERGMNAVKAGSSWWLRRAGGSGGGGNRKAAAACGGWRLTGGAPAAAAAELLAQRSTLRARQEGRAGIRGKQAGPSLPFNKHRTSDPIPPASQLLHEAMSACKLQGNREQGSTCRATAYSCSIQQSALRFPTALAWAGFGVVGLWRASFLHFSPPMAATDATRVLLNATRSEAEELLQCDPPPHPSSLRDSAADHDDLHAKAYELEEQESRGYGAQEMEKHGGRAPELKLWAPPSRGSVPPAANGGSAEAGCGGGRAGCCTCPAADGRACCPLLLRPSKAPTRPPRRLPERSQDVRPRSVASAAAATPAPATPPSSKQATAVVEWRVRPPNEAVAELREVDVRAAFAGLPRIKPHWTHKCGGSAAGVPARLPASAACHACVDSATHATHTHITHAHHTHTHTPPLQVHEDPAGGRVGAWQNDFCTQPVRRLRPRRLLPSERRLRAQRAAGRSAAAGQQPPCMLSHTEPPGPASLDRCAPAVRASMHAVAPSAPTLLICLLPVAPCPLPSSCLPLPAPPQIFQDNPEALCTEIVLQDSEHKVFYHYLVQDTPGQHTCSGR